MCVFNFMSVLPMIMASQRIIQVMDLVNLVRARSLPPSQESETMVLARLTLAWPMLRHSIPGSRCLRS